jgi:hypothetical protein
MMIMYDKPLSHPLTPLALPFDAARRCGRSMTYIPKLVCHTKSPPLPPNPPSMLSGVEEEDEEDIVNDDALDGPSAVLIPCRTKSPPYPLPPHSMLSVVEEEAGDSVPGPASGEDRRPVEKIIEKGQLGR